MVVLGLIVSMIGLSIPAALSCAGLASALTFFGFMSFVGLGNGMTIPNATAGMLSIFPRLAGTASGLGSAIMIGGGAALSAVAGIILNTATTDFPLIILMLASVILGLVCITYVLLRKRTLKTH
jgi:DHA1 family bicyclomycin/chloramphenicol resistance-like MFS transporter